MTLLEDAPAGSDDLFSPPDPPGGPSPSSSGSSGPPGTGDAASALVCPVCDPPKTFQGRAGLVSHIRNRHPGTDVPEPPAADVPPRPAAGGEVRPKSDAKRSRWGWSKKARTGRAEAASPSGRPRARRVSTARLGTTLTAFAAGGVERLGQGPLAMVMGFTAPVAGEIADDVIAGTIADRLVQPFVRGSGKYENLGALTACWVSVLWASNNPENAEPAYAMFSWSMETLLPLMGKEMAARAKERRQAAEQLAEVMPELQEILGPGDPIQNLWTAMWAKAAPAPPVPEPEGAPVP